MQLTVNNFLILPEEQLYKLTCLNLWDEEEETDEDLSLLSDKDFTKLCELFRLCRAVIQIGTLQ